MSITLVEPRPPFGAMQWLSLRNGSDSSIGQLRVDDEIALVHLRLAHVPVLLGRGFGNLRALSLRDLRSPDLHFLRSFPKLEVLEVWQSRDVRSLEGIEALTRLRWLCVADVGPLDSLAPLAALSDLEELVLKGGIWKDQKLLAGFEPVASLRNLRKLTIANVPGLGDLSPLLDLPKLEHLQLATARFPVHEVARLAARYSFFREQRSWVQPFDADGCERCGGPRTILLLQRERKLWCNQCDAPQLARRLEKFEELVESNRPASRTE